jgi:tetratricopeptide (TPR) repeat protein
MHISAFRLRKYKHLCFNVDLMANILKILLTGCMGCFPSLAHAQSTPDAERYVDEVLVDTGALQANIPDEKKLDALEARIQADPQNLDHYFAYSQMATQLRIYDKSAQMYERMLQIAPNLPRVKLELAMNYMQLQEHDRAKALIDEVMQGDLPTEVKRNLEPIITQLSEATKRHFMLGSVSMGMHYDTNANSAPRTGNVDVRFNNTPIEVSLTGGAREQQDVQVFGVAQAEHYYRINDNAKDDTQYLWHNSLTAYRNEYDTLDDLNVSLAAVRTGTVVNALDNTLRLTGDVGYTHITLERQTFQRHYLGELTAQYALNAAIRLQASSMITRRDFVNSDTNRTFELRDGYMRDHRLGLSYSITKNDIVESHVRYRREDTKRSYFDNHQYGVEAAYTHSFNNGVFTRAHADYNTSYFDAADLSISTKTRKEYAAETGLTLGVPVTDEVTATVAYQYRDVNSNIQNYDFDSHRISTGVNARF